MALYSWFTLNVEFDGNEIMKTGRRLRGVYEQTVEEKCKFINRLGSLAIF